MIEVNNSQMSLSVEKAPEDVQSALRAIDPDAVLLSVDDHWMLAIDKPNPSAISRANRELEAMLKDPLDDPLRLKRFQIFKLLAGGLRHVHSYPKEEWGFAEIVEDFKQADAAWKYRPEEEFERRMRDADGTTSEEERKAVLKDKASSEGRFLWRYAFRGLRHITQGLRPRRHRAKQVR